MTTTHSKARGAIGLALTATLVMSAAACGGDDDETDAAATPAVDCPGEPVQLAVISSETGATPTPGIAPSVRAAVDAVNRECTAGRPFDVLTCDDGSNANSAADCAREVVDAHPLALVGAASVMADNFEPIVLEAGIPSYANAGIGSTELSNPLSFPTKTAVSRLFAEIAVAAAAGADSITMVGPDVPSFTGIVEPLESYASEVGTSYEDTVSVPPDATDYAQYAAQASDSDAIVIALPETQMEPFLRALIDGGVDFEETIVVTTTSATQEFVDRFGGSLDGMYIGSQFFPLSATDNEGIAQYLDELEASDEGPAGSNGMNAWRGVHDLAEIVPELPEVTPEALATYLETHQAAPPEAAPYDFSTPAYPNNPLASELRVFSSAIMPQRVEDGEIVALADQFLPSEAGLSLDG